MSQGTNRQGPGAAESTLSWSSVTSQGALGSGAICREGGSPDVSYEGLAPLPTHTQSSWLPGWPTWASSPLSPKPGSVHPARSLLRSQAGWTKPTTRPPKTGHLPEPPAPHPPSHPALGTPPLPIPQPPLSPGPQLCHLLLNHCDHVPGASLPPPAPPAPSPPSSQGPLLTAKRTRTPPG